MGKGIVAVAQVSFFPFFPVARKASTQHAAEQALADGCVQSLGKVFFDSVQQLRL